MATDRLERLLADLEAQGIDAARLRVIAGVPCTRRCDHPFCDRYRALRALADAATEPEPSSVVSDLSPLAPQRKCSACNGSGSSNPLHHCPSDEVVLGWSPCPECGGSGDAPAPAEGERCPTCGSDDPAVCNVRRPHPHGSRLTSCCSNPFHNGASR